MRANLRALAPVVVVHVAPKAKMLYCFDGVRVCTFKHSQNAPLTTQNRSKQSVQSRLQKTVRQQLENSARQQM